MFLEFAAHLHVPVPKPEWRIQLNPGERVAQSAFFAQIERRPIATIIPATATVKKDWLAERWASVADVLERDYGFSVVLAGGPGAREQAVGRDIVARSAAKITWAMGDSVRRLSYVIEGSDLLIAPDTGPVHIARAFNVPVIGLYGHTNPWRVGPWRAYEDLWVDRYTEPGSEPDPSNRTPKWDRMPSITVPDVIERIDRAVTSYRVSQNVRRI
jgi:heptosyltransferase I